MPQSEVMPSELKKRMVIHWRYILFFAFALPASPGTFTNANCSITYKDGSTLALTSPSYCGFYDVLPGSPRADLAAGGMGEINGITGPVSATHSYGSFTTVLSGGTYAWTDAVRDAEVGDVLEWVASATSQLSLTAATVGPKRPGLIEFEWNVGAAFSISGVSTAYWNVGSYFGSAYVDVLLEMLCLDPGASMPVGRDACGTREPIILPFLLGAPFDMGFELTSGPISGGTVSPRVTRMDLFLEFRVTELDGTPVDVHLVPEPGSWALTATGLLALMATQRFRTARLPKSRAHCVPDPERAVSYGDLRRYGDRGQAPN